MRGGWRSCWPACKSKVNLIPLNAAPGIPFERPSDDGDRSVRADPRRPRHLTVSVRKSRGRDIRAACGQLIVEGGRKSPAQHLARRWLAARRRIDSPDVDVSTRHPLVARRGPAESAPSGSCRSPRASRPRASARDGSVPTCAVAERARQAAGRCRGSARPRSRIDAARHLAAHRRRRRARAIGIREDVEVRQRRAARGTRTAARSPRRVSPGKPTMMSEPIEACGIRARMSIDERRVVLDGVRPAHRRQHPVAGVLQRQMKMRREAIATSATRSTISREQSIGSSELMRNRTAALGRAARVRAPAPAAARRATTRGVRSRPYDPRWTPVSAISLNPAADDALDLAQDRRRSARFAAAPRVVGNDAVRARLRAAGLHAQRERRAARDARLDRPRRSCRRRRRSAAPSSGRGRSPASVDERAACRRWQRRAATFGSAANFVRPARRVAAGDDDPARRDCRGRSAGWSAARPDRRWRSPSRC